jgi:UV DNA damage endonuclease
MRFNQFEKHDRGKSLEILGDRALENLQTTLDTMKFAHGRGWGYRISSTLFPLFNLDKAEVSLENLPNATLIADKFAEIYAFVSEQSPKDFRICFHPDHFNVLCSANEEVVRRTINELDHHAWLMDEFAGEESRSYWYPLNIHMSRSAGDPEQIAEEFISNYQKLPKRVQQRLVLENEDKGVWTPDMLFELIHQPTGIPISYDNLHHRCNPGLWDIKEAFRVCCSTWKVHGVTPLFHYSEGGANDNPRAHTDFATSSPAIWRTEYDSSYTEGAPVDWDIEIKQKDYAIDHMQELEKKQLETYI